MKLSDLPVGALVKDTNTKYNGETIIWRVMEHGHTGDPSGTTALECRDILTLKCFDATEPNNLDHNRGDYGNNRYSQSNLLQWLNSDAGANSWYTAQHEYDQKPDSSHVWASSGTPINPYDTEAGFLTNFSSELKAAIQTVTKVTAKNAITDDGGYENVSNKIFLLSKTEVGYSNENNIAEGSIYAYYSADNQNSRKIKNAATDATKGNYSSGSAKGVAGYWWLRTPSFDTTYGIYTVTTSGTREDTYSYRGSNGVSPAMCISSNIIVSNTTDSDGCYVINWNVFLDILGESGSLGTITSYPYKIRSTKTRARTVPFSIQKIPNNLTVSSDSVELNNSSLTAAITCTRSENATITAESSNTSVATVSVSGNTVTISHVNKDNGSATVTIRTAETSNYLASTQTVEVTAKFTTVYGVYWDGSSSPDWYRTDASANFTDPVPQMSNGSGGWTNGSSPFDNLMPWSGMQKVEDSNGGTLVAIPKFYYKWTRSGRSMKLQIADGPKDGFLVSPAHADRGDGSGERDVVYVGRYHCATSTYKSTTGVKPQASMTRATARSSIHNLGSKYWQWDYAMLCTIQMLYLVEFAHWNSQLKIGYGCGNNSSTENAGSTDSMTYHTGTNQTSRTAYGHTQYRWIEDLWGNVYDWCDGIYFSGANVYCIKNPASFSDTSGGTLVGTRATSSNEIQAYTDPSSVDGFEYAIYPSAVTSNSNYNTYACDYCSYDSSGVVLRVGGSYGQGLAYGLFFLSGYYAASDSSSSIGSRLQKLP